MCQVIEEFTSLDILKDKITMIQSANKFWHKPSLGKIASLTVQHDFPTHPTALLRWGG